MTIAKKEVTVEWGETTLTYNGKPQLPTATLNGVVTGDDVKASVTGEQSEVGTNYTATASLSGAKKKFKDTVEKIIKDEVKIPAKLQEFMKGKKQSVPMTKNFDDFKKYLLSK